MSDPYVRRVNQSGHTIIASEACGGVVESDMTTGRDTYLPTTLLKYIEQYLQDGNVARIDLVGKRI